ncbi:MAG: class I SAM-dependent methyltransferase [Solirubrobacteraceae bacterium]
MSTTKQEVRHPIFARMYTRMSAKAEERGGAEHRDRLLVGLAGRVVEVGAGNGLNFAHYPEAVSEVLAVEPEPYLREQAREAAERAAVTIQIVDGLAEAIPAEDGTFDAGVASLVLCTVPDQSRALAELYRVIRAGGELRFYEHVVARDGIPAALQRVADATLYPRLSGGCHLARDTGSAVERAGFTIESCDRFAFTPMPTPPTIPHILGAARRP